MNINKLNICLSMDYAKTLGNLTKLDYDVEHGASVRNKFIFKSLLNMLNQKHISYKIIVLNEKINLFKLTSILFIPFFIMRSTNLFRSCSTSLLAKLSDNYQLPEVKYCDVIFLHNGYSLLKYYYAISKSKYQRRPFVILEMPENIIETDGYLSRKRYCINKLENALQSYARIIDAITSPTLRDSIYYSNVLNVPNVFTIYNVYNIFPEYFTDDYILSRKDHASICISTGSWCNESITKFINNIIRLLNVNNKINITDIHILGCRKMPQYNIGGINVYFHGKLPLKDYLNVLSRCIITILYPRLPWSGGHSVRLNDAALMGNILLGSDYDLRGEPYKYQYTYIDERDLVIKLKWLMDSNDLISLGMENRRIALERVKKNEETLERLMNTLLGSISNID